MIAGGRLRQEKRVQSKSYIYMLESVLFKILTRMETDHQGTTNENPSRLVYSSASYSSASCEMEYAVWV